MDIPLQKEEDLTPTYSLTVKRSEIVLKQENKGICQNHSLIYMHFHILECMWLWWFVWIMVNNY
jgi:hypothetical protein